MSLDRSKPIDYGSFSDTAFLGSRQSPSDGEQAKAGNLAGTSAGPAAVEVKMVPSFMDKSGQGDNQSTQRPKGSV